MPEDHSFDLFFRESKARVVGMVALITHNMPAAEDAAQEGYTRAYRRWDKVRSMERPDLWVVTVAGRIAIDNWRKRKSEAVLTDDRVAADDDPVEAISLRWGLKNLSPTQRLVAVLYYGQGLTAAEVAKKLGSSEPTVYTHLQRARFRLRHLLGEERVL
jgi:RNA polymerase sigma-70 factor (ECF subfamily)